MIRRQHLPVADTADGATLRVPTTGPVWPGTDAEDIAAVRQIADLFGRPLARVNPETDVSPESHALVAGLGPVADVGRLYAALTGRRFATAPTAAAAASDPAVELVMCVGAQAPHDLLDALTHHGRNLDVGILWAPDLPSLRRQALLRSAAASLDPVPGTVTVVSPLTDPPVVTVPSPASSTDSTSPAILAVTTHSDGVDAFLGPLTTICAVVDVDPSTRDMVRPPKCILTQQCHRHHVAITTAVEQTHLVSVRHLAARVLVWNACLGIMSDRDGASDGWSLLRQFVSSPSIGVLLVARGIVFTKPSLLTPLVDSLNQGQSVRSALHEFAHTVAATSQAMIRDRMFIFGDPATVAQPPNLGMASLGVAVRASTPSSHLPRNRGDVALIENFVDDLAIHDKKCNCPTQEGLAATFDDQTTRSTGYGTRQLPRVVAAIAETTWSAWTEAWLQHATLREERPRRSCAMCGGAVWSGIFEPAPDDAEPRFFSNCARCGATDDRPVSREAQIEATTQGLRLIRGGPVEDWAGAIVSAPVGDEPTWSRWPARPDGRPSAIAPAPSGEQTGPVFRLAVFIEGCQVSLHMRRVYIDAGPGRSRGAAQPV